MEICNEQLITAVQAHVCLYNKSSALYKNKAAKDAAWEAGAEAINSNAYNCKTRWRSLCDRYRKEKSEDAGRSGAGTSFRKQWKLFSTMQFIEESAEEGSPVTNVDSPKPPDKRPSPREPPKKKKVDDLFEDVLIKMRERYSAANTQEDEIFFSLLKSKLARLSQSQKDELQADILALVSNKLKHYNL
ncbi:uncharacterized protein [Eurosta solidaginis]|uniref:uncharacterized protein n=2 Tax=Eurosta solidaginis TaxID=178769 RepID=UPI0035315279